MSLSDITDDHFVGGVSGNAALNGRLVTVLPLVAASKPKWTKKVSVIEV
ncbi:MAG: hypothetical protein I8H92_04705 [Moraxellaceae bacterium]|nr:hypothetical protein [Moraxellaceae bacterium]